MRFSNRTRYLAGASFIALALTLSAPEDAAAQSCMPAFGNGAVVTCSGDFMSGISGSGFSDLSIYFAAGSSVTTNAGDGVTLFGGGAQTLDASNATITSTFTGGFGIVGFTTGGVGDLTITTGASVSGDNSGITAFQGNTGLTDINVGGDVAGTGANGYGILFGDSAPSGNIDIYAVDVSTISGGRSGIEGRNFGTGDLIINVDKVTGGSRYGIYAQNYDATTGSISVTARGLVSGGSLGGVRVDNSGGGTTNLSLNSVTTTGPGVNVTGDTDSGAMTIGVSGSVSSGSRGVCALRRHGGGHCCTRQRSATGTWPSPTRPLAAASSSATTATARW